MKKIKILVLSVLMFLGMAFAAPTVRAEGEITTETPITETITIEEPVEVTEPEITLPAEWADLTPEEIAALVLEAQDETKALVDRVFAWIGGFAGLSAVLAFVFKWLKDRGYLNALRTQIDAALASNVGLAAKFDTVVEKLMLSEKREAALEKTVVSLITLSAIDPALKAQVLKGLAEDTLSVKDVIDAGLLTAAQQSESNAVVVENINVATQSLLEKLASK